MSWTLADLKYLIRLLTLTIVLGPVQWAAEQAHGAEAMESLRDPTMEPRSPETVRPSGPGPDEAFKGGFSVIVIDGHPHVIIQTRLYAQGQKFGQAVIERISETEVWLREGGQLRKVPMYAGIERSNVLPAADTDCVSGTSKSRMAKSSGSSGISLGGTSCAKPKP
ncbi:MAG: hypothetical protein KJ852_04590 [Gammaproteobacteria bacterium]|nr:hypothetical protein [Gammaproteobacteria bacterium]MBU0786672.1 hypothetical protein [Gammaproteobacteria bacterium]MBU0814257.1 hypothetical protein [Gammaproteobacteria bacterium]MBU1786223.1 hypothetical protein [Gammaproteobacteria bacterium]